MCSKLASILRRKVNFQTFGFDPLPPPLSCQHVELRTLRPFQKLTSAFSSPDVLRLVSIMLDLTLAQAVRELEVVPLPQPPTCWGVL